MNKNLIYTLLLLGLSPFIMSCTSKKQVQTIGGPIYTVGVSGMTCAACPAAVRALLKKTDGVGGKISSTYEKKTASFQLIGNKTLSEVIEIFNQKSDRYKLIKPSSKSEN